MAGQMMIDFGGPEKEPVPPAVCARRSNPAEPAAAAEPSAGAALASDDLPALRRPAGYELYRDATRTVLRVPGEERWTATIRIGPTSHRFVAAGADAAALWRAAARVAAIPGREPPGASVAPGEEP